LRRLQLGNNGITTGDLDGSRLYFVRSVDNLAVVDNDSVTLSAVTLVPANALRESELAVRGEDHKVVLDSISLAPSRHDKGVVGSNEDNLVNTLALELVGIVEVRGNVRDLAGRCESARDGDKDHLLLLELLGSVVLLRDTASLDIGVLAIVGDVAKGNSLREAISSLEFRHSGEGCEGERYAINDGGVVAGSK
jgi:hypothetical protein